MKALRSFFGFILVLAVIAALGRLFFFRIVQSESYDMVPSLVAGDYFLVYTRGEIDVGDVAVCADPENPSAMVALRVLGIPGDTVELRQNHPFLNGRMVQHEGVGKIYYIDRHAPEPMEYTAGIAEEYVGGHRYRVALMDRAGNKSFSKEDVKDGLFLVGDNRNRAYDSRNFGEVAISECIGRALVVVWPGPDSGDLVRSPRVLSWI